MALSRSALEELRRELAEVRRKRSVLDAHIQGLEIILAAEQSDGRARVGESADAEIASLAGAQARHRQPAKRREKGSFRRTVLDALQKAPGSKCAELARVIEQEGFRIAGVTSLRNRISHEIYRLRRLGVVRRERSGLYVVAAPAAPAEPRSPDRSAAENEGAAAAI
jgi:hypothetical protein